MGSNMERLIVRAEFLNHLADQIRNVMEGISTAELPLSEGAAGELHAIVAALRQNGALINRRISDVREGRVPGEKL